MVNRCQRNLRGAKSASSSSRLLSERSHCGGQGAIYQFEYLCSTLHRVVAIHQGDTVGRSGSKQSCWQWSIVIICRTGSDRFGEYRHCEYATFAVPTRWMTTTNRSVWPSTISCRRVHQPPLLRIVKKSTSRAVWVICFCQYLALSSGGFASLRNDCACGSALRNWSRIHSLSSLRWATTLPCNSPARFSALEARSVNSAC